MGTDPAGYGAGMSRLLLVLAIGLALLTGCGGGDDGGSDGDDPTRKEFVGDANAICREGEQKIEEVSRGGQEEIQQATTERQQRAAVADVLERTTEEYRPYLDRLRELQPPADIADAWSSFVDGISEAFDLIPELAAATRDNDEQKLAELNRQFTDLARDTRPFAKDTGLDDCLPDEGS
jgi:hypothetical protein